MADLTHYRTTAFALLIMGASASIPSLARADGAGAGSGPPPSSSVTSASSSSTNDPNTKERNFYQVLDDVMADFEFDLKNGNVGGIKNLSIRNIALSENIPPSFRNHLELLVTERILKTTKTKITQCLPCRARKTTVNGDKVVISSAETNPAELSRIAKDNGIDHFMDIAFAYQPSGIVLSMTTTEPESGAIIWSRNYNSETSRAEAIRRGVDYTQIDDARKLSEYAPTIQHRFGIVYFFEPNGAGRTGVLGASWRTMERYDNRKKEVGFELNYLKDSSTIVNKAAAGSGTVNLYSGINLTLLFMHTWNFIGEEENYNRVRGGMNLGVGGTYASGFLGALARVQYEWRMGKHYSVTTTVGYRPKASAFIGSTAAGSIAGAEFGIGIGTLF